MNACSGHWGLVENRSSSAVKTIPVLDRKIVMSKFLPALNGVISESMSAVKTVKADYRETISAIAG